MKGLLFIFSILSLWMQPGFSQSGDPVLSWVEKGDVESIEQYLLNHDVNGRYGESGTTMLLHSIQHGDAATTAWLIGRGADANQAVDGITPLMYASGMEDGKKVTALIQAGADMEAMDPEGNTALFYAASNGNLKITKHLVRRGADLFHKNNKWFTAYDMAVRHSRTEVAKYLRTQAEKNLPDLLDGPYVKWKGRRKVKVMYLVHESKSQITRRSSARFKADSDPYLIKGFSGDSLEYRIDSRREVPPDRLDNVGRIMVMGDIHGGYDSLVNFLQSNGVIDDSLHWTWGRDYLVFVGDIFDRGDKVTEALWLIYQLEQEALQEGGAVHLVLGNHEIMVLSGKTDYVSDKYLLMTSRLNIDYPWLFGKRTVLGQWLRTRNTIVKINGHLFVHAGLSPDLMASGLDIGEINDNVRYFLNHPERMYNGEVSRSVLLGPNGPFWYRGFLEDNHEYDHLPEEEFKKVLDYFSAQYVFVGHTNVKQVTSLYDNHAFAIDVPFYTHGFPIQGLLVEGNDIYLLDSSAHQKKIN